jgi:hypothetical protein
MRMSETTVQVKHLITDVDMRPTRALISGKFKLFGQLGRGQIALLLNRACTIARFIDSEKTIHTMYAEKGEQYDLATIESMVQNRTLAIGVKVVRNPRVKPKHVTGITSERIIVEKKTKKKRRKAA